MDLVCSLLDHREDLDLAQMREHLDLYIARPWPAGVPDPVRPWEVAISAPGGNLLGWKIPEAAVQTLVDDALDLQNERSRYRRLAGRI